MKIMTNAIHAEKKTSPLVNDEIIFYNEEPRDRRDFSPGRHLLSQETPLPTAPGKS